MIRKIVKTHQNLVRNLPHKHSSVSYNRPSSGERRPRLLPNHIQWHSSGLLVEMRGPKAEEASYSQPVTLGWKLILCLWRID